MQGDFIFPGTAVTGGPLVAQSFPGEAQRRKADGRRPHGGGGAMVKSQQGPCEWSPHTDTCRKSAPLSQMQKLRHGQAKHRARMGLRAPELTPFPALLSRTGSAPQARLPGSHLPGCPGRARAGVTRPHLHQREREVTAVTSAGWARPSEPNISKVMAHPREEEGGSSRVLPASTLWL